MQFQLLIFYKPAIYRKISPTTIIHQGYFPWTGTLWADGVSPRMNTIASRDQFKPIRVGENLKVNHNEL